MEFPKVYLFAGDKYWRYDVNENRVDPGWPKDIETEWRRLKSGISGALNVGNGKAYFFYGREYRRFDIPLDRVYVGPLSVAQNWPGVPDEFIGATVRVDDDVVCFLQDNKSTRFSLKDNHALPGYPRRTTDDWPGMPDSGVDAAVNYGNGSIYFFKDHRYTRFDIGMNRVAQPWEPIVANWHGVPDIRIDAAVEWSDTDLTAACVPIYDPSFWNDWDHQGSNNCYNYGCNRSLTHFSNPGRGSGGEAPQPYTTNGLDDAVRSDGLVKVDPDNPTCTGCRHVVMLFRSSKITDDFHFYHRNTDGMWSHKPGVSPATNLDFAKNRITDPRTAVRGPYDVYVGTYCVDRSVLRIR